MNMNLIEIWNKDVLDYNTFDMRIIEKIIDYHRYVLTENNNKLDREQHYNPDEGIIEGINNIIYGIGRIKNSRAYSLYDKNGEIDQMLDRLGDDFLIIIRFRYGRNNEMETINKFFLKCISKNDTHGIYEISQLRYLW